MRVEPWRAVLPWLAVAAALLASPWTLAQPVHHDLAVSIDPAQALLQARTETSFPAGAARIVELDGRYTIERLEVDGAPVRPQRVGQGDAAVWRWTLPASPRASRAMRLAWRGEVARLDVGLDHRQVLALRGPVAGAEGVFLPAGSGWHPQSDAEGVTYRVRLDLPATDRGLVPGRLLDEGVRDGRYLATFEQREPLAGIDLFAGPYAVREQRVMLAPGREVPVRTYFHAELASLAEGYLESAARYLLRYDALIGPYPFAAYAIVSSPLPTGFGMPGVAYLGRQVIRLPFIRATSLGHEVLHNWWGNGVVPDYARGNWSEGLTTFMADYAYREDEGAEAAREMRVAWLRDFAAVRPELDLPLARFVSRRHGADQAVGYNKTAFVFFMLRDLLGREAFDAALRDFYARHRLRTAGWGELRAAFERALGRDLAAFFAQWVERPGAPSLRLVEASRRPDGGRERVAVTIAQTGTPYALEVPLRVHLIDGRSIDVTVTTAGREAGAVVDLPAAASAVSLDPQVRLFRRLDPAEIAPILRQVLIDPRTRTLLAGSAPSVRAAGRALAEAALDHGMQATDAAVRGTDGPMFIVGLHADVAETLARAGLPPVPQEISGRGTAFAYAWREEGGQVYAVASARDEAALAAMARALPHLGAQSHVVFDGARSSARGVWRREPPRVPVGQGQGRKGGA